MARHAGMTAVVAALVAATSVVLAPAAVEQGAVAGEVTMNAVGDFGTGAAAQATFAGLGARPGDLTMALGDLSYSETVTGEAWCNLVKAGVGEGYPFQLVAGNHESNGQHGRLNDYAACLPNQLPGMRGTYAKQNWVDHPVTDPLVRIITVSPVIPFPEGVLDYSAGSSRYQWTAAAIDGARAAGIPWVVVAVHVPCLSVGNYGCTGVDDLANLFVQKKVDLVLTGHEHLYQRTHQLSLGAGCPALTPGTYTAACVADTDDAYTKGSGTVFATVGTGGVELRNATLTDPELPWFASVSALNQQPTFGFLALRFEATRLAAEFVRTPTRPSTFTDDFTVQAGAAPPPNTPPTAAAAISCTGLACTADGSTSTDTDGTVVGWSWQWGDGTSSTGANASHTYAAAGTYTVTLTVTDDDGATASTTRSVTVTAPPGSALAADAFGRTVASGWGVADTGGAWTASVPTGASASVNGSTGLVSLGAGRSATLTLPPLGTRSDLRVTWGLDRPASGSGLYVSVMGRRVAGQGDYRAKVRHNANGTVGLSLVRTTSTGAETALASELTLPGLTLAAGDRLAVRLQVVGTGATTVQARAWRVGTPEPTTWQRAATDSTPGLQAGGGVGFYGYLSGSATNVPVTVSVDDLDVRAVP